MLQETKFKIKAFIWYIFFEPLKSDNNLPNIRTLSWVFIIITIFLKNIYFQIFSFIFGFILYLYSEWKAKKYIHFYRVNKYKRFKIKKSDKQTNHTQLNVEINEEGKGEGDFNPPSPQIEDEKKNINI